jgi:hypothetical protein
VKAQQSSKSFTEVLSLSKHAFKERTNFEAPFTSGGLRLDKLRATVSF